MSLKTSILLAGVFAAAACARTTETGGTVDGGSGLDPKYSFSLEGAQRACARDEDCMIATQLRDCASCCGSDGAIARSEAYAAVVEACGRPGAPPSIECGLGCPPRRAACFEGACVQLGDPDAGRPVFPTPTCPTPSPTDGGTAAPELGPGPACGASAVRTGFEDGLDPSWTTSRPEAVRVDRTDPLAGAASLRIAYRQESGAYLTIPQPDACAVRVAFTVRTRLLAGGLTLLRVVAGEGWWFHVRLDGCSLNIAEETQSGGAAGIGFGGEGPPVPADTPVRVVLTVDLRAKTITTAAAPLGQPLPAPQTTALRGLPSGNGAITAIELGAAHGVVNSAVGVVQIDDLVID